MPNSLAALVVLAQMAGTVIVSDRTEARLRSVPDERAAVDLETAPVIQLSLDTRRTSTGLGYGARLVLVDLRGDAELIALHRARAQFSWSASRRLRLTLSQDATLGREVLSGLAPPQTLGGTSPTVPTVTFVPRQQILYTGSLRSSVQMAYVLSRQWSTTETAYYEIAGGVDTDSQAAFPRRNTIGGDAAAIYRLTRADQLATTGAGSHTEVTTTGGEFITGTLLEAWQHNWSIRTTTTLGAGVSYLRSRLARGAEFDTSIGVAGRAEVATTRSLQDGAELRLSARATMDTQYNSLIGAVTRQAGLSGSATWTRGRWGADALVAATTTLPSDNTPTVRGINGSLVGTYSLTEAVELQAGARAAGQLFPDETFPDTPILWVAFAAISVSVPLAHF